MKRLIWNMPAWVHGLILKLTGYRLVMYSKPDTIKTRIACKIEWSKEWPPRSNPFYE